MLQLTGLDTTFLNIETATTYGHVGGLAVYKPNPDATVDPFESLRDLFIERMHLIPFCRRRLVEVPLGIDQPYWIEDPDFDLNFHIRHLGLPPPGSKEQLAEQVARIVARPLDRRRPLWELYVIEGLEGGYVAHLSKVHHCAIDGVSGAEILATLLDAQREHQAVPPPKTKWKPEAEPSDLEMLGRGLATVASRPTKGAQLLFQMMNNLSAFAQTANIDLPGSSLLRRLQGNDSEEMLSKAATKPPRTSFNDRIGPHRRFAYTSLSLGDIKFVKGVFGVTVNDVVLAICSTALRSYLEARDELPSTPLISMVPVSIRSDDEKGKGGNRVAAMTTSLHSNEADLVKRLGLIHQSMRIAKETHNALPASLQQDLADFSPPAVAARAARLVSRAAASHLLDVPYNVVISNVPGPQFPLYGVGSELLANYPVSTIHDGAGLNITVLSYNGNLDVGVLGCRDLVPDAWELIDRLEAAAVELKVAAEAAKKKAAGKKPAGKKKASSKKARLTKPATKKKAAAKKKPAAKKKATGGKR